MILALTTILLLSGICTSAFYLTIQTEVVSLGLSDCVASENRHEQVSLEHLEEEGATSGLSKQLYTTERYAIFFSHKLTRYLCTRI